MARRRRKRVSPHDNVIVTHWSQSPQQTRLHTDPDPATLNWPFGDDVADVMESLDDAHFQAYCDKVQVLIAREAMRRPPARRRAFLRAQRARLDGYRRQRGRNR